MTKTIDARIVSVDDDLSSPQALHFDFSDGTCVGSGVSFCYTNPMDMQELAILLDIVGIFGTKKWARKLLGKKLRLMVDIEKTSRTGTHVEIMALGHYSDDDMFLVLGSGEPMVSIKKAEKLVKKMKKNKEGTC